ncbi:hypothetical protein DPMN_136164 [Dreissena polymorpha]|uniref:Uncharacterized protein n=1 Tax=Dreissena polymorpha TaxID=45954 RepID=A0A9D4JCE2_DREPO|nr:hypothetical protein DPMN_136164 [Dreissena polymorpha]
MDSHFRIARLLLPQSRTCRLRPLLTWELPRDSTMILRILQHFHKRRSRRALSELTAPRRQATLSTPMETQTSHPCTRTITGAIRVITLSLRSKDRITRRCAEYYIHENNGLSFKGQRTVFLETS